MQADDVFKDLIGDMTCLRIALEELKAAQSAGNLPAFNALFGTFGSTLYHVTERAEKFHDVTDRWDFINNNLAVSLCYEMGTRYKHGLLDQRYLSRHPALMETVSASASAVYTILEPWEVIPTEKNRDTRTRSHAQTQEFRQVHCPRQDASPCSRSCTTSTFRP